MRYALIILAFLFCTIKTDAQVYQAMPQPGYGPVKRMLIDSVLTIPIGISTLRNITGGRDTAQLRYQKSDSSVYVYSGSSWIKLGTGGGGGSADSTVFFTVYRADTMRANIYGSIPQPDTIYARYPVRISNDTIYLQQAFVDSVYAGGGGNFVPYTGATQDVDLGARKLSAASIFVEGTNGNGHIHLKHQNGDATATGNSTSLYADTNGDIKWKNDGDYYTTLATSGNTANRVYTFMDTTGRVVVLDSGRLILRPIANNGTLNNSLQLANRDGRSYFNISTNSNVTNLTIKANTNAVLDSFVIADSGLIAPRTNATMWLRPTQTGNNNIVANRCAGCGTGSIFSANVGTSAPIFNMLSTGQMSIGAETPVSTAALDITSTTRGLLIPRMTTSERNAISTPASQLIVANTTTNTIDMYQNGNWSTIAGDYSDDVVAYRSLGSTIQAGPVPGIGTIQTAITMFTGRGYWAAVYVKKPITITGAAWFQTIAGSYTGANYNGLALYSYSGGTLTLVDSSTRDNTIWTATTATWNSKAFAGGTRTLSPGIYYVAAFYNNSAVTTNPQIGAVYSGTSTVGYTAPLTTNSARISGWETSITTPPSTKTMSSFTGQGVYLGLCLY